LFDKTGTVTDGRMGVVSVETHSARSAGQCLAIAAALEAGIRHPIARALQQAVPAAPARNVQFSTGYGVSGEVDGKSFRLGSARFVGLDQASAEPGAVWLADATGVIARLVLADRLRPHARAALDTLGTDSELMLVSGDSEAAVAETAGKLDLDNWKALQSPQDKLELLRQLQQSGAVVAAVGDGINDAPLLAQADVSVAMLAGSQLAQASADIVFTGNDLRTLARLPELAQATRSVVRQNLTWAACYNLTALPLAAAGLLHPWMAALGMSLSSLVVVGNALRLNRVLVGSASDDAVDFGDLAAGEAAR
jgi:Cu2+-exporting ATPase